jgi:hypothetical protein
VAAKHENLCLKGRTKQKNSAFQAEIPYLFATAGNASLAYGYESQAFQANNNNVFNPSFA